MAALAAAISSVCMAAMQLVWVMEAEQMAGWRSQRKFALPHPLPSCVQQALEAAPLSEVLEESSANMPRIAGILGVSWGSHFSESSSMTWSEMARVQ